MSDSYHSFRPNKAGPKHLTTFLTHFGGESLIGLFG